MSVPLTKIDSAIAGLSISDEKPETTEKEVKKTHKRHSSVVEGIWNIKDLEKEKLEITLPIETQKTGWKIDLHFPLGLEVTARNSKGVTIKDALDAIHKQFKKKADDELDKPYLAGFEWDKEDCWTRLIVHQKKEGAPHPSKKSKKKSKDEA
ncbi:hypothetical protein N7453_011377 [Penicillium expansum]|nr:hypothetical protein N7453_011377 [Penicillium expansum]